MPESPAAAPFDQGIFLLHRNKGKEFFQKQQLEEAATELEAAHRIHPDDEQVLNLLGMAYFRLNKLEEAKTIYNLLIDKNPAVYSLHSNIGLIYLKQNTYDAAERHFGEAAALEPDNPRARMYLGLIYERQRKYVQALDEYKKAKNDKMIAQMEQLLRRYAERGEPLPTPSSPSPAPAPARPLRPGPREAAPAGADSTRTPTTPLPMPVSRQARRPEALPEPAVGAIGKEAEGNLRMPRVLPAYMKKTDFFNPDRKEETEMQLEMALDRVLPGTSSPALPKPAPPSPSKSGPTSTSSIAGASLEEPPKPASIQQAPQALNITVLTQPSQGLLKLNNDEFRILNRNYLDISFEEGLIAGSQRLIGAEAMLAAEPYAGIEGLLHCSAAGRLLFYEDQFRIHLLRLTGEFFFVKPGYVIAIQPTLKIQLEESSIFRFLRIEGDGIVALAISTAPVVMDIGDEGPLIADVSYLAGLSTSEPIKLKPSKRPGFIEVIGRGNALLFPATRVV